MILKILRYLFLISALPAPPKMYGRGYIYISNILLYNDRQQMMISPIWSEKSARSRNWKKNKNTKIIYYSIYIYFAYYMQNVNAFYIKLGKLREIFIVYCSFECLKD